jgi:hypothetical protein
MEISQSTRYDSSSLVSIQALRGIAALLVFWGHAINAVHLKVEADFPHLYGPFGEIKHDGHRLNLKVFPLEIAKQIIAEHPACPSL